MNFDRGLKQYRKSIHISSSVRETISGWFSLITVGAEALLAKSGFAPDSFSYDEERNALRPSPLQPTIPMEKFEYPIPTYLTEPQPQSQPGWTQQKDNKWTPWTLPLESRGLLKDRLVRCPYKLFKYGVNFGESFWIRLNFIYFSILRLGHVTGQCVLCLLLQARISISVDLITIEPIAM
jgi:hypothetical protein